MVTASVAPSSQWRHRHRKQWQGGSPAPVARRLPILYAGSKDVGRRFRMVKRVWSRTLIRRGRILEHARELARTGKYQDHLSILAEVRQLPDSRMVEERWFQTPDFLRQLDLTCAEAREVRRPTGPGDERRPAATCANGIRPREGVEEGSLGPAGEARAKAGVKLPTELL
jgi:hypothetical protein